MTGPAPIRLVVLLEDLEFGGTQRYALQLMQGLDRRWFAPEVWVLRGGDHFSASMRATGVEVLRLSDGGKVGPAALVRLAVRLWRERPALLYTLTVIPNIWGRLFAGIMRIPVISGYRGLMPRQHDRLLHRFSARIIANFAPLEEWMIQRLGIEPDRVAVVANGVDGDHFTPDEAQRSPDPLVVCVARLVGEKDIPTLLEAFRLTRTELPAARLEIIGNGPTPEEAPPNVRFLPGTEDIRGSLRRAWVFALASRSEGSPNAVLEAMACRLPVVATAVGGIPHLVEDMKSGRLVPPRDPVAMSAALVAVLTDAALRDSMGRAARQRALTRFRLPRMVQETETVLREVAERGTEWTTTSDGRIPPELPLWPSDGAVGHAGRVVERGKSRPDRSLRDVGLATLTVFLPPAHRATGDGIVICPGGGYAGITIDKEGYGVARWLTTLGIAGLVLKYRLPRGGNAERGTPWPLQDVTRALALTRQHADEWRIDAGRIGVIGFSAGGHMAAYASNVDRSLAFSVLVYPVISMEAELTHRGSRLSLLGPRPGVEAVKRYSMEHWVTARTAPTLLVHACDDDVVDVGNSRRYAEALRRCGVPHQSLLYERGGHGFGLGDAGRETSAWPIRCLSWLRERGLVASTVAIQGKPRHGCRS